MTQYRHVSLRTLVREDQQAAHKLLKSYLVECRKAFPDPNEIGSYEEFQLLISLIDTFDIHIIYDGDIVVAGAHVQLLSLSFGDVGLTEHLWVAEPYRRQGIGSSFNRQLLNSLWGQNVQFHVQEINDPFIMNEYERTLDKQCGITPEERIVFWKKQGFQALDVSYSQPRLSGAQAPVTYCLMAIASPTTLQYLEKSMYLELIREYFLTFLSDVVENPTYQMICRDLASLEIIPIIPLDVKRNNIGDSFKHFRKDQVQRQKK